MSGKGLFVLTLGVLFAVLLSGFATATAIRESRSRQADVTKATLINCESNVEQNMVLSGLVRVARRSVPDAQFPELRTAYDLALDKLDDVDCQTLPTVE